MSTIVEIAKRAGVSHQLVSNVLNSGNNRIRASKATQEKIHRIAKELAYRPHRASQMLRENLFRSVGVLIGGDGNAFYVPQQVLTSLSQTLSREGYTTTLVGIEGFNPKSILECEFLKTRMVDLLLISYVLPIPSDIFESIQNIDIPTLWLMRKTEHDAVYIDEKGGSSQLVHHLVEKGHRRITFVDYTYGMMHPALEERLKGFDEITSKLGVEAHRIIGTSVPRNQRFSVIENLLKQKDRPHAIIANSMSNAQIIIQTAHHLGLNIPKDLAVVSFDEHLENNHMVSLPTITCAIRSNTDFGVAVAAMTLEKIQNPNSVLTSKCMPYDLVLGGST